MTFNQATSGSEGTVRVRKREVKIRAARNVRKFRGLRSALHQNHTCCIDHRTSWYSPRVVISLSGEIFETREETLERFPDTVLGCRSKRDKYFCHASNHYFFDRSRLFFDAILFFYQSGGILRRPYGIPYELFAEECRFYELPEDAIVGGEPENFKSHTEIAESTEKLPSDLSSLRSKVWEIFQNPRRSRFARYFSTISLCAVCLSVISSCLQSMPALQGFTQQLAADPWSIIEVVLNTFFLIELILKALTTPNPHNFFTSKMTWIDMVAVVPYFFVLAISNDSLHSYNGLRVVRMVRVVRMLRFSNHSKRIALIGRILVACMTDLKTLLLCIFMVVVLAGSVMYHLEYNPDNHDGFCTVPTGVYWAVQTLFTVGYGDIYPVTAYGKMFAGAYMMFGSTMLCMPLLSIIARFQAEWPYDNKLNAPTNDEVDAV